MDALLRRAGGDALASRSGGSRLGVYADTGHPVLGEMHERIASDLTAFAADLP